MFSSFVTFKPAPAVVVDALLSAISLYVDLKKGKTFSFDCLLFQWLLIHNYTCHVFFSLLIFFPKALVIRKQRTHERSITADFVANWKGRVWRRSFNKNARREEILKIIPNRDNHRNTYQPNAIITDAEFVIEGNSNGCEKHLRKMSNSRVDKLTIWYDFHCSKANNLWLNRSLHLLQRTLSYFNFLID